MNNPSNSLSQSSLFSKVSLLLTIAFSVSAFGTYLGQGITSVGAIIGLGILMILGTIGVFIAAKKSPTAGITALTIWSFVTGLFLGPCIHHYLITLGWQTVFLTYLGTGGVMAACGAVGALSGINFSRLGNFLMVALLGMIVVGIFSIFIPMSHTVNIVYCIIGMIVFAGFFIVVFFRLANSENTWEAAIEVTMNLFLDFLNFLLYALRLIELLSGNKK